MAANPLIQLGLSFAPDGVREALATGLKGRCLVMALVVPLVAFGCGSSGTPPTQSPSAARSESAAVSTAPPANDLATSGSTTNGNVPTPVAPIGDPGIVATKVDVRLPQALSRAAAVANGSVVLIAGGLTAGGTVSTILAFDPAAGTVSKIGDLPYAVHDAGAASAGGVQFVFGGGNTAPTDWVQTVAADGTSSNVGTLPKPRADLTAVSVGAQMFVVGGGDPPSIDPKVLSTFDGTRFTTIAKLTQPVRYAAVAAMNGKLYVIGGEIGVGSTSAVQVVDLATGAVTLGSPLPAPLSDASAIVLGGELLVAGGRTDRGGSAAILRIDPVDGTVSTVGQLPYKESDAAAVVLGTTAYLVGGESQAPLDTIIALQAGAAR